MLIKKQYLNMPVRSGATKHILTFSINGRTVREFDIELTDDEPELWVASDVSQFRGEELTVNSPTLPPEMLSLMQQSDEIKATGDVYAEKFRPRFHFTTKLGWNNDPNGLVYYQGEYHLFYQHNPFGLNWGNMYWGHAISNDLLHWEELGDALEPDGLGAMFSGSAVVDWENTADLQSGFEHTLVCFYTSAGGSLTWSEGKPFVQSIAYSNDRGRTWTKYANNPVVKHIVSANRDPKVIWHQPTRRWVMALYLDKNDYALLVSPDLKQWEQTCTVQIPGGAECPDFFDLPVDGNPAHTRWVLWSAHGNYLLGDFDGTQFVPDGGVQSIWGGPWSDAATIPSSSYAAQTWSDIPPEDGRRIQICWLLASLPGMPFTNAMTFPTELTLKTTANGIRLNSWPIREIAKLHGAKHNWQDVLLQPGENPLQGMSGAAFDITAEFQVPQSGAAGVTFGFEIGEVTLAYDPAAQTLTCRDKTIALPPEGNAIRLRILVDRGSLEIFGNGGVVNIVLGYAPDNPEQTLAVFARNGSVRLAQLEVAEVGTIWPASA
jgi:fructan beta-fructosidase